ncbi:MAG: WYL domain-containing protein [Anaerolineae bacterium]|nr:WYL domain-containing protein [Anaerolineae bacterium]
MLLLECLQATPLRTLWALCQANGFPCHHSTAKADLVAALHPRLLSRTRPPYLAQLPADQRALLEALAQEPQPWPLDRFQARFGTLRPFRPWRRDAVRHPWHAPASPAEALFYHGLLFLVAGPGRTLRVVVPDEAIAALQRPPASAPPLAPAPLVPLALLDLALLLTYLQQADVRPLHGRWLSPHHCRRLGACLLPPLAEARLPSERHSLRLAFAHYLAERLQLVTLASGLLKSSPKAAVWLDQSLPQQLLACWQAWLAADDDNRVLWRRFHLPGHPWRDPPGLAQRLVKRLPLTDWRNLTDLLPWWEREAGAATLQEHLHQLLHGPLAGLGIVAWTGTDQAEPVTLTAIGAWLIHGGEPPALPTIQPLVADPALELALPANASPPLAAMLHLADWAELAPGPRLRFTPASLARSLGRDQALSGLRGLWHRFVTPPLTDAQHAQLKARADQMPWVELHTALLLRTSSPKALEALWADPRVRPHLAQRLAGDLAVVRSPRLGRLLRVLTARGYALRTASAHQGPDRGADTALAPKPGDRWWLYTSYLVHRLLAEQIGLSMPPGALQAGLAAGLDPAQQAAAQEAAEAAVNAVRSAMEGPPAAPASLPLSEVEDYLLAAIEADQPVHIVYWSPWQNAATERCVRPLQLHWRGDHRYLLAFCLRANAQRTFRLDRILHLSPCSPPG